MKMKITCDFCRKIFLYISVIIMALVSFKIFWNITNFVWYINITFGLIVFLPAIIVLIDVVSQKKDVYNYLTLLIFYSGCTIAIVYFKPITHGLEIPKLNAGTVGFRSNNAEVEIHSIRIWYQDSLANWKEIPKYLIRNKNNWLMPVKPYSNDIALNPIKCIPQREDSFLINNCTVLFIPESDSLIAKFSNVRIEAKIKFISITGENPGFSFITNRSTKSQKLPNDSITKIYRTKNEKDTFEYHYDVEDLCLEFVFPFNNYAHPWIPALEWMPGIIQTSSFLDVEQSDLKIEKKKKRGKDYKLSAFVFDDQVRFEELLDNYKGVKCLFEAKIDNKQSFLGIDTTKHKTKYQFVNLKKDT